MHLGDHDRGKLEKAIDNAVSFASEFTAIARGNLGKDVMKVTNARDFVFGSVFAFAMLSFIVTKNARALTQDESFDMLGLMLRRFFREIDILKVPKTKAKKQRKR